MDASLRSQLSAAPEFSGRLPSRHCPGRMLTSRSRLQRNTPCCEAGRMRECHHLASSAIVHAPSGGHRQATNGRPAALPETASLATTASGPSTPASPATTSALEPPQRVAAAATLAAAARTSITAASAATQADAVGRSVAVPQSAHSAISSFEDLGALSSSSDLELDSEEPEMCSLVADPSGDVQVVCESDPGHPLSLAEAAVFNPPLPQTLLQDIEAKLEADLTTIAVTILFAVGFITLEFGINDLIEHYYGESVFADVVCVSVGLAVVFWVKLSKARLMRFDRWR